MSSQRTKLLFVFAFAAIACSKSESDPNSATSRPSTASSSTAAKLVKVTVDESGFDPSSITVPKGTTTTLLFTRTTNKTCADKVVFPDIGIAKDLPLNTPVSVVVPTDEARKLTFQCGMGMYKSNVVVQ